MSSPGSGIFSGFTKLCKGLTVILIGGHIVVRLLPSSVIYLTLIPARTIPFGWNLITAGYIEQSLHGVVVSVIGLLFMGKLLEPIWGSKEFLKFIFIWLPSLMLLISIAISFFTPDSATYLPTLIFGAYMGWIYLRYFQRKPEAKHRGDPSEDFAFSTFFPEFLRPIIDPIASVFHRMLCGKSEASTNAQGYTVGGAPLIGSDPIEASRRRERGARALEERLAAERLAAGKNSEEPQIDESDNSENGKKC
ncbi:hypothetical protein CXB51_004586 [Gossypium anomalum]|uniref:Rhomboid protein n=1 Tax=Gossypium anomalum TaxID=47600 RepID=A0A8J5ZI03_9ROSI|nr:hypothetical protein CXB51_004586 [Gossypium anomalum]